MKRSTAMKPSTVALKRSGFTRPDRIEAREVTKLARKVPAAESKVRTRKCSVKSCRAPFTPRSMTHKCCSPACAADFAVSERVRKERSERQEGLRKLKRKADHVADCQKAFNAWVRFRDRNEPCIDCGRFAGQDAITGGKWDAGHYLSRGSHAHLRFDERNVFKQLKGCNRPGGTTAASFRAGVEKRIGIKALEALESDYTPRHYTVDQLIAMTTHYRAKLRALKSEAAPVRQHDAASHQIQEEPRK